MPLPKVEYHAEEVTVESAEYGRDDRGFLTCTLFCEWSGGSRQGFGNLHLDEVTGPAFVRDLCAFFGVEAHLGGEREGLLSLRGRRVRALWFQRGGAMDGLELDGRRFLLWEWRRRMHPDAEVLDPRADRIASLRREIASRERRLAELRDELSEAVTAAYDWSAIDAAARALRVAGAAWRESADFDRNFIEAWANICHTKGIVGDQDPDSLAQITDRILKLSVPEPIRILAADLRAELGVQ